MRVVVFSDTHGNMAAADKIVSDNISCDHFIFLGDGINDVEILRSKYPDKSFFCVAGNCDKCSAPTSMVIELFNTRILLTHGHLLGISEGTDELVKLAKKEKVAFALFGHTHKRYYKQEHGIYLLNPGSASLPKDDLPPSCAFMDITPYGINCMLIDLT
ncbi:MAG: YfcE family phosphodiesterase [Ruminococcus sp.]|nr:YfcE family phosphodiesterase [Ruminococcus sp.]